MTEAPSKAGPKTRGLRRVATIHDVARRAGVSVATVSRVLNGKEVVREETVQAVLEAAKALRYVPNVAARSLSSRRTQTIGIVLPDMHGEFFSEVIRGVDSVARGAGFHILVSGSHSDAGEMLQVLDAMHGRVDGLIVMAPDVTPSALQRSLPRGLPLVLLNARDEAHHTITVDNYGGARTMVRHLAELGHRRIAFLKGPAKNADAGERLRGYRDEVATRELVLSRRLEIPGDFTEAAGRAAVPALLAMSPRPTALFAANDSMAVGALVALGEAHVAVPEEISVAGFDDIPIARYVVPALTTIHVDIADLGSRALHLLLAAIGDPEAAERRSESLATTLVPRGSCRGPQTATTTPSARPRRDRSSQKKGEGS